MPLCKALPAFIEHQLAMIKRRRSESQRLIQQQLPRCRAKQILAANNFGDRGHRIIDDDCELIRRKIVMPPNDEIAEVFSPDVGLHAGASVDKRNRPPIRNPKPPIHLPPPQLLFAETPLPTCPRIHRLILPRVRRLQCPQHIRPRTHAWVNNSHPLQPLQRLPINLYPPRLKHCFPLPPKSEPLQILKDPFHKFRPTPRRIQILNPQQQLAPRRPRPLLRHPKRPRMPQMQPPRRRRRQPPSITNSTFPSLAQTNRKVSRQKPNNNSEPRERPGVVGWPVPGRCELTRIIQPLRIPNFDIRASVLECCAGSTALD